MRDKIIAFLIGITVLFFIGGLNTSKGEKKGIIVKLADEGIFNSTHEAELIRGGMNNGSGSFGMLPFDFTIKSPDVYKKAEIAFQNQSEIRVKYYCELCSPWSSQNRHCFVEEIV